jgi:hypothetical protein
MGNHNTEPYATKKAEFSPLPKIHLCWQPNNMQKWAENELLAEVIVGNRQLDTQPDFDLAR